MNLLREKKQISDILFHDKKKTPIDSKNVDWDNLIKVGSSNLILPLIYNKMVSYENFTIPNKVKKYLKYISKINENRNKELIKELKELSEIFNKNKIKHVFLKGSALILGNYYKNISSRMIGDIDILIDEKDYKKILLLLKKNEYYSEKNYNPLNHRHYPRIINKKKLFALELHKRLLKENKDKYLTAFMIFKERNKEINIPCKKHLLLHCVYSELINDYGLLKAEFNFKNYYEVRLIGFENKLYKNIPFKYLKLFLILNEIFGFKNPEFKETFSYKILKSRIRLKKYKAYRVLEKLLLSTIITNCLRVNLFIDILKDRSLRENTYKRFRNSF